MSSQYEIKEVGFIGSLWRGKSDQPKLIGRTFEVKISNELSPIRSVLPNLGTNRFATQIGSKTKIYLVDEDELDLNSLNKNLSDSDFYFEVGTLPSSTINDFYAQMKLEPSFLSNKQVLFRYKRNSPKEMTYSKIPIQKNWNFDTSTSEKIIYSNEILLDTTYVEFVILLKKERIDRIRSLFGENGTLIINEDPLLTGNTTVLDPLTGNPTLPVNTLNFDLLIRETRNDEIVNDVNPFGQETITQNEPQVLTFPSKPEFVKIFVVPSSNDEEFARKRALELFTLNKEFFQISNIDQFNRKLDTVNSRIKFEKNSIMTKQPSTGIGPYTTSDRFNSMVDILFNEYGRNYLYEQICIIENVDIPEKEPERWSINENGIISILPRPSVLPNELVATAIEDRKNLDEFDSYIDELIEDLTLDDNNIYVFKKVSKVSDYSLPILRYKTKGLFRCGGEKLSTFYTGSITDKNKKYYTSVFNEIQGTEDSFHQFDITYCHISGSGSSHIENEIDLYPAKSMYRKYMLECFGHTNGKFPFKNGINGDYFYAIQLNRDDYREKLDAGNFELSIVPLSSSINQLVNTGSNFYPSPVSPTIFTLVDESKDTKQEIVTNEGIQEYYYITSGSIRDGIYNESGDNAWGVVFPKMGLIILDGVVLDQSCSFNTVTASIHGDNPMKLFTSISGAASPTGVRTQTGSFFARSFETFLTETYFCRADFNEFNTSTNYTYTTGSDGFLKYDYFAKDPQTFITTVGLYNKQKELLAVGKLRNPIRKNDGKVCIFEVVVRLN